MMSQFLLLLVLVTILSNVQSFVGRSNRVQTSTNFKHPALLMSKASQEKADEKKRKQAMVDAAKQSDKKSDNKSSFKDAQEKNI
mmetsp:Transcript_21709/g.21016  ORF Transcript_21709/g.21016 Transcript_21709/m.21016 type:complete len:84 (+) Transcript_21709:149-400(+)